MEALRPAHSLEMFGNILCAAAPLALRESGASVVCVLLDLSKFCPDLKHAFSARAPSSRLASELHPMLHARLV